MIETNERAINPTLKSDLSIVNGKAEMFSGQGVVPWHGLGTVVKGLLTAQEAIVTAHLDWDVNSYPITVNGVTLSTDDYQGLVRSDNGTVLGIMKGRYEPIQNKDCFDFLDTLAGEGMLKYETAGALRLGKKVWLMAKYDGEQLINNDKSEQWLLACTSHDGSMALSVQWISVRVVCQNTLSLALKGAKNQVSIRHTENWEQKAKMAKEVLGLTKNYFTAVKDQLTQLSNEGLTSDGMQEFSKLLFKFDKEGKEPVPTRTQNMRDAILARYNSPSTGTYGQTRWDALNAVSDYVDHDSTIRGQNTRMESALMGNGQTLKQRAFEYLTDDALMKSLLNKPLSNLADTVANADTKNEFNRLMNA